MKYFCCFFNIFILIIVGLIMELRMAIFDSFSIGISREIIDTFNIDMKYREQVESLVHKAGENEHFTLAFFCCLLVGVIGNMVILLVIWDKKPYKNIES